MSATRTSTTTPIALGGIIPVLRVRDTSVSVDYYTRVLGFKVNFQYPEQDPFFASVSRGQATIFLSQGDQGNPGSWVWIDGKDVEALHEEFLAAGAKIRHPPTNYSWALEMQVEDPDGNILRFGSDPKKGEPDGEWLDMYGHRWLNNRRIDAD